MSTYANDPYNFERIGGKNNAEPFTEAQRLYHNGMNDFFNKKLARVVELMKNPVGFVQVEHLYCVDRNGKDMSPDECARGCFEDDVSTFCVSMQALDQYRAYLNTMYYIQTYWSADSQWWALMKLTLIADVQSYMADRDAKIADDISNSQLILESTLKAYNEFLSAYPVHKIYEDVIKNLIKYKNKLKQIRLEVEKYPATFVDTTSTKCQ